MSNATVITNSIVPNHLAEVMGIDSIPLKDIPMKPSRRVAKVLNVLYTERYGANLEYMYEDLEFNQEWYERLTRGILLPNRRLVNRLIVHHNINPSYLFYQSNMMFL